MGPRVLLLQTHTHTRGEAQSGNGRVHPEALVHAEGPGGKRSLGESLRWGREVEWAFPGQGVSWGLEQGSAGAGRWDEGGSQLCVMSAVENGVRMLSRGRYVTYVRGVGYLHGL